MEGKMIHCNDKANIKLEGTIVTIMVAVALCAGGVLASMRVNADNTDVVDQVNITVPVSCTMSGTGMTSHNANIVNGTYTPDIGTTTLHAFCKLSICSQVLS